MDKKASGMGTKGSSMSQGTATRSGSRPNGGKTTTPTSAPKDSHTLGGRAPKGWLK